MKPMGGGGYVMEPHTGPVALPFDSARRQARRIIECDMEYLTEQFDYLGSLTEAQALENWALWKELGDV